MTMRQNAYANPFWDKKRRELTLKKHLDAKKELESLEKVEKPDDEIVGYEVYINGEFEGFEPGTAKEVQEKLFSLGIECFELKEFWQSNYK